jgi:AraC family transcriptional regulator
MSFRVETLERHRRAIRNVIEVMRGDPSASLDLEAMAAAAYMSRFHFLRVFEEATRISPARFLASLRMQHAKRLLLDTSWPVTKVCFEAGYNSLGTFTRLFTDSVGVNPSAFRKLGETLAGGSIEALPSHFQLRFQSRPALAVAGSVQGPPDLKGPIFLGVFPSPIPQQRPTSGALLLHPGRFELTLDEGGHPGCLMAAGFRASSSGISYLLPSQDEVLVASIPLSREASEDGRPQTHDLILRPVEPFDPPILTALPILLQR